MLRLTTILFTVLAAGCAAYDGRGLRAGLDTEADVRRTMGAPAEVYEGAGGARTLAYPRGPLGTDTFMARIGPDGRLAGIEQVLDEAHFARIVAGRSTPDEVRRLIGPPGETGFLPAKPRTVWTYRFRDAWHYLAEFSVLFDPEGRVAETVTVRVEGIPALR